MAWSFDFASWIRKKARIYTDSVALNGVGVNYPQIDPVTRHWRVFDPVANAYIDTGVVALGRDGLTPYVGANGNWWIDTTDTGVTARGPQGLAGTIEVESTTTGASGTNASVTNVGTPAAALLRFTIPRGAKGDDGDDGREVEIQNSGTFIQWRYVGASTWNDIVALSALRGKDGDDGDDGETPQFRMSGATLQVKFPSETNWTDLYTIPGGGGGTVDPSTIDLDEFKNASTDPFARQSEARDFSVNPILEAELGSGAVTDSKIGYRAVLEQAADKNLVPINNKYLTTWIQGLRNNIKYSLDTLAGMDVLSLDGALLTRVIGGAATVAKSLFAVGAVFVPGKTLIYDENGTLGVVAEEINAANISVETMVVSPIAGNEPRRLGEVDTYAELPLTVSDADAEFGLTPIVGDYARITTDENEGGKKTERAIVEITAGALTWGNATIINDGDYQEQSTSAMAGKVLTGGDTPGTFGNPLDIDTAPTENSGNLVSSGGVFAWFGGLLSSLKTTAQTVIGAINELFDSKLDKAEFDPAAFATAAQGTKADSALQAETDPIYTADKPDIIFEGDTRLSDARTPTAHIHAQSDITGLVQALVDMGHDVDEARAIAEGRSRAKVFADEADMNSWLSIPVNTDTLNVGDNLYILDLDVPDYWWDGTAARLLGTEKVDLTDFYTRAQIDLLLVSKVDLTMFNAALADKANIVTRGGWNTYVDAGLVYGGSGYQSGDVLTISHAGYIWTVEVGSIMYGGVGSFTATPDPVITSIDFTGVTVVATGGSGQDAEFTFQSTPSGIFERFDLEDVLEMVEGIPIGDFVRNSANLGQFRGDLGVDDDLNDEKFILTNGHWTARSVAIFNSLLNKPPELTGLVGTFINFGNDRAIGALSSTKAQAFVVDTAAGGNTRIFIRHIYTSNQHFISPWREFGTREFVSKTITVPAGNTTMDLCELANGACYRIEVDASGTEAVGSVSYIINTGWKSAEASPPNIHNYRLGVTKQQAQTVGENITKLTLDFSHNNNDSNRQFKVRFNWAGHATSTNVLTFRVYSLSERAVATFNDNITALSPWQSETEFFTLRNRRTISLAAGTRTTLLSIFSGHGMADYHVEMSAAITDKNADMPTTGWHSLIFYGNGLDGIAFFTQRGSNGGNLAMWHRGISGGNWLDTQWTRMATQQSVLDVINHNVGLGNYRGRPSTGAYNQTLNRWYKIWDSKGNIGGSMNQFWVKVVHTAWQDGRTEYIIGVRTNSPSSTAVTYSGLTELRTLKAGNIARMVFKAKVTGDLRIELWAQVQGTSSQFFVEFLDSDEVSQEVGDGLQYPMPTADTEPAGLQASVVTPVEQNWA